MRFRSLLGLPLLLVQLGLAGCLPKTSGPVAEDKCPYYVDGRDRLAKQDFKGAKRAFEKSLAANPRSALAHYELGLISEQQEHDYPVAIYHYRCALELRPDRYPADNAKVRIRSCRQELVKEESLSPLDRGLVRDMERLRTENAQLRQQLEELKKRQAEPGQEGGSRPVPVAATPARSSPEPVLGSRGRSHVVRKGDTAYSLARTYGLTLRQLQAANPGMRLDKILVGQEIRIPQR